MPARWLLALVALAACDRSEPAPAAASSVASSAPAPGPSVSLPFSQEGVDAVIGGHRAQLLKSCVAPHRDAELPTSLELVFEVDAQGAVADVAVMGGGAAARPVRKCIEAQAQDFEFAPPPKPTTATASLVL